MFAVVCLPLPLLCGLDVHSTLSIAETTPANHLQQQTDSITLLGICHAGSLMAHDLTLRPTLSASGRSKTLHCLTGE